MEVKGHDQIRTSDRVDAESLFRAHATFVAKFLRRRGISQCDLDDLVQEVFLLAHRKGGYIPGPARPTSWLAAIAVRVASQERRSQRLRRVRADKEAMLAAVSDTGDPAEALDFRDAFERVQRALEALAVEHRHAFLLYEVEGKPCSAIAAASGVPVGTIYSRIHHARQRLIAACTSPPEPFEISVPLPRTVTQPCPSQTVKSAWCGGKSRRDRTWA